MSASWLHRRGRDTGARVIDVRSAEEFVGPLGHIEGADLVPMEVLEVEAGHWDRDEAIVFVCRSGRRSGIAANALEQLGFSAVASMRGGMQAWNEAGFPRD